MADEKTVKISVVPTSGKAREISHSVTGEVTLAQLLSDANVHSEGEESNKNYTVNGNPVSGLMAKVRAGDEITVEERPAGS